MIPLVVANLYLSRHEYVCMYNQFLKQFQQDGHCTREEIFFFFISAKINIIQNVLMKHAWTEVNHMVKGLNS